MASEKAKQLARQQKEAAKAEKLRKKNSDDPKDWGQVKQIVETYKMASKYDKTLPWWLIGSILVGLLFGVVLGLFFPPIWMWLFLGFMAGITLAMFVFLRRVKAATYKRFEGQAGSAEIALGMLGKKWTSTPALTGTRQMDVIHRALGPGGLLLITEGDPGRLKQILATEVKRHEQVAYGVKVITIAMGEKDGQVPLNKLAAHIKKLPVTLQDDKIADVKSRLKALDNMRSRMPIPKGPMPNVKGSRSAMRGR